MVQYIVPILIGVAVFLIGGALLVAQSARRARIAARLSMPHASDFYDAPRPSALIRGLNLLGTVSSAGKASRSLREELARAGFHGKNAAATFIGAKMLLFAAGIPIAVSLAVAAHFSFRSTMFVAVAVAGLFFFIPNLFVQSRRNKRVATISGHLPDAIDLLEISVSAGMGIDQAWNAVTDEVRSVCPDLADEMALTNLEIHLGAPRPVAMRHMAERTGALELGSLVACLVQAERFGTSMRDALRAFAMSMREGRSHRAQEAAERVPVKLIFPMVVFIFGPAIMVMAGPAVMALFKALGNPA